MNGYTAQLLPLYLFVDHEFVSVRLSKVRRGRKPVVYYFRYFPDQRSRMSSYLTIFPKLQSMVGTNRAILDNLATRKVLLSVYLSEIWKSVNVLFKFARVPILP